VCWLQRKVMDPNGDVQLRDSYHAKLCQMLNFTPRAIVDLGCASGLSTFGLHQVRSNSGNCKSSLSLGQVCRSETLSFRACWNIGFYCIWMTGSVFVPFSGISWCPRHRSRSLSLLCFRGQFPGEGEGCTFGKFRSTCLDLFEHDGKQRTESAYTISMKVQDMIFQDSIPWFVWFASGINIRFQPEWLLSLVCIGLLSQCGDWKCKLKFFSKQEEAYLCLLHYCSE